MKPRVYIETTVLSYLTVRPSRDLVQAAHQQITTEWWATRVKFDLFVSDAVLAEITRGDPTAAEERLTRAEVFQSSLPQMTPSDSPRLS